jgi:N-acetylmuramoyl-L-alanine amidase
VRGLRVVIGQFGGLSALARALTRELRLSGAIVITVDEPDARAQAAAANAFEADVYLGFEARTDGSDRVAFYAVPQFESAGGRSLAERVATGLTDVHGHPPCVQGARLQVLRETRMPAILASVGSVRRTVDQSSTVAVAVRIALDAWADKPL